MGGFARAFWTGWRLRCPACGEGSLEAAEGPRPVCPRCRWQLTKPGEGDWLVTWLVAYTVGSVGLLISLLLLYLFSGFGIGTQLIVSGLVGLAVMAITFRRSRGAAIGILYFLRRHWEE